MDKKKLNDLKDLKIIDKTKDTLGKPMKIMQFTMNGKEVRLFNCIDASTDREYHLWTKEVTCWKAKNMSFGVPDESLRFSEE